ncbi:tetratricopeptide repeat protein [Simplicispira metamorpha]|uniref:SnoaL-like protein n=1 Tax=Simplicispira metamorpha TaxID=80881 RepID=A0A4R2NB12_9BURK|nr:tetratricopeptide repeat protein [Simplicispira metamorpha]TCP18311.1 SnoaL-like protein [Simplicispira metamorpha]
MKQVRRNFSDVLRLLALTALLGASAAHANEYGDIAQLLRTGKAAEALAKADQLLVAKPRDPQLRFLRGVALTEAGKPTEAIAAFSKLTQDYPELPEPYNNLAVLYASQNQFDKARAALEMAIRTNPSYATAHENLGDVYARLASQAYNKALQLDATQAATVQPKLGLIRDLVSPVAGAGGKDATKVAATPPPAPAAPPVPAAPVAAPAQASTAPSPAAAPAVAAPAQPAPAAAPAAKPAPPAPAPAPAAPAPDAAAVRDITSAVQDWAKAWAAKDMPSYLSAYGKDFVPAGKQSRKAWETERRDRIVGKSRISVKIDDLQVKVAGTKATARFRQSYSAGALNTQSRKTLEMVKVQNQWLIVRESVGN